MKISLSLVIACFFSILFSVNVQAACLRLAADTVLQRFPQVVENLVSLFSKNNICMQVEYIPGKRSFKMLKSGDLDGEVSRIKIFEKIAGDIVQPVPTPVFQSELLFVSRREGIRDYTSYRGKIGIIRGWAISKFAVRYFKDNQIVQVDTIPNLVELYTKNRVDAILMPGRFLRHFGLQSEASILLANRFNNFMWISNKNNHLIEKIDTILKKYRENGGDLFETKN